MTRHAQIFQNEIAISLQYLNKEVSDAVDFLHADKHGSLLQIGTILMEMVKYSRSSEIASLEYLYNTSKKRS